MLDIDFCVNLIVFAIFVFLLVVGTGSLPFLTTRFGQNPNVLNRLTAIAAGFLIAAALLVVVPEGFEIFLHSMSGDASSDGDKKPSMSTMAGLAVLLGFLTMMILEGLGFGHDLHEEHHDHSLEHGHGHVNHPTDNARSVVIGLSIHSVLDGIAIGAAYATGELALSVQLALVVLMHKFPAALSLTSYSLHERGDNRRTFTDLLLFALTTPVAMLISAFLLQSVAVQWLGLWLLFAAGSFIYVATVDVLPSIHIKEKSRQTLWWVLLGMLLMASLFIALDVLLGARHPH